MNARERSRVETRRRLMEQGAELCAQRGVANTRASDIAQAAGVAVGTLYLHFGDKQGLLRAILFEGVEDLLRQIQELVQSPPPELSEAVRRHTEIMVQFAEQHPALCHILFDPESVRMGISKEINNYLVSMQEVRLREGAAEGLIPAELNVVVTAHAVVGMFVQVLDWWTRNPERPSREVVVDTMTRLRLSGLYLEK